MSKYNLICYMQMTLLINQLKYKNKKLGFCVIAMGK